MKWTFNPLFPAAIVLALLVCEGCSAPSSRIGGFESDNPATVLYAIQQAGQQRDRTQLPHLVEALENDDPAVRMMAIVALEKITGQRLGYQPYETTANRAPAVTRWQTLVRGELTAALDAPPATHAAEADAANTADRVTDPNVR